MIDGPEKPQASALQSGSRRAPPERQLPGQVVGGDFPQVILPDALEAGVAESCQSRHVPAALLGIQFNRQVSGGRGEVSPATHRLSLPSMSTFMYQGTPCSAKMSAMGAQVTDTRSMGVPARCAMPGWKELRTSNPGAIKNSAVPRSAAMPTGSIRSRPA